MRSERVIVVKMGGSQGVRLADAVADIRELISEDVRVVVVHGGSQRANELGSELGYPARFLRSPSGHISRYTDERTRDIFVQAVEQLNGELIAALERVGVAAKGLTGQKCAIDGERKGILRGTLDGRELIIRDDFSGDIRGVDEERLWRLLDKGYTPVLPPLAWSGKDGFLNVDGDRVAAQVAVALNAGEMILLSNVPGLLRDPGDEGTQIDKVSDSQLDRAERWAQGRMKRKLIGIRRALGGGVRSIVLADGRVERPLLRALGGSGTHFYQEEATDDVNTAK